MKKKLMFLLFILSLIAGCSSTSVNDISKDNNENTATYTITFDANGGTGLMDEVKGSKGDNVVLPYNKYVRAGYIFQGWSLSKTGNVEYINGSNIILENNLNLFAVWKEDSNPVIYTVIFNSNGGQGNMSAQQFNQGEEKALSLNLFTFSGRQFLGWSTVINGNPEYSDGEVITCNNDLLLYAVWSEDTSGGIAGKYTVTFEPNNGDGYMLPLEVEKGSDVILTENIYTRGGYLFKGWSTTIDGPVVYQNKQYITVNSNMTLYAVWEKLASYTITYYSGTTVEQKKEVKTYAPVPGGKIYLEKNNYTNGALKFVGWSDKANGNVIYQDEAPLTALDSNLNLYAVWAENPRVISFDANGGTGEMDNIYALPGTKIYLPEAKFKRAGWVLKGTYDCIEISLYPFGFGTEYTVTDQDVNFKTAWVELPKEPLPVFGGNSKKYKNQYVLIDGVTLTREDWIESLTEGIFYGVWKSGAGWYDAYQGKYNLCWAASSSNLLHWWYDRNKENIDKYYAKYASEEAISMRPLTEYKGKGVSDIFEIYKKYWPNNGYFADRGLEWYIKGSHYNNGSGGYFKEVFENNFESMVARYSGLNQYLFNTTMEEVFEKGMGVSLAETNAFGPHATTLWGVHYDNEGLIDAIIISDSATASGNNAPKGNDTGLLYLNIEYDQYGKVFMTNSYGSRLPLNGMTTFSQGKENWNNYFNTHNPIR